MNLSHWLKSFGNSVSPRNRRTSRSQRTKRRHLLEQLESRALLSAIHVTTFADVVDAGDGVISLREAVTTANSNAQADTINLPAGTYTLTITGADEGGNATGDLDLLNEGGQLVTIRGAGASSTIIQAGTTTSNGIDRVFEVRDFANLTLDGVTVRHGKTASGGGGIFNLGTVTVTNSTISGNSAFNGGGIFNPAGEAATVTNSTISGNSASNYGGGIRNSGRLTVTNSTISGNSATRKGGGIYNNFVGRATVTNSTISGNSATAGGGIYNNFGNFGTATVNNTIITNSPSGGNTSGTISGSNNLIGTVTGFDTTLADNGGPTLTHKLLAGSNAIDAGSNSLAVDAMSNPLTTDQRGFTLRNFNGTVDIGAFEFGATAPVTSTLSASIVGNDLVIEDIDGTGKDNVLSVSRSGADLVISDANQQIGTAISGAVLSNGNKTVTIPATALGTGGKIIVKGQGGSDSLSVDVSTDLGFDVEFQGGTGTSDSLTLAADTVTSVTHAFTNANDGSVTIVDGGSRVITYTGLEPITDNLSATDRVFTFNGGAETITLTDASGANMTIDSTLSENVTFANPTGSLTINAGTGADNVTITSVDTAFRGAVSINGDAGSDTVNWNGAATLGSATATGNVSVVADVISVTNAIAADTGRMISVSLTSTGDVSLSGANADVTTGGGSLTVDADSEDDGSGVFATDDAGSAISTAGGAVSITAADVALLGTMDAGAGGVSFLASQAGATINLGAAASGGGASQVFATLAGSTLGDTVKSMTVDGSGNVYVTGTVDGTLSSTPKDFAGNTLTGFGGNDVYVAKLDSSGVQQFIALAGGTSFDSVTALTVDGSGNVYVTGTIVGNAMFTPKDFAGNTITGRGNFDVYVAKLNSSGVQQFFSLAGSTSGDSVTALTVDGDGNIYVTGKIRGTPSDTPKDFAGNTLTGLGSEDVYVSKLNSSGVQQFFALAGSYGNDSVTAMTVDGSGNVYLAGTINGDAAETPKDFAGNTLTGRGGNDVYVAKLNSSGVQQFFTLAGGLLDDAVTALTVDGSGNVYVTGTTFMDDEPPKDFAGNTLTGRGGNDVYVAKLNSSGVQQFFTLAGSTSDDAVTALTVDGSGNVYVTGTIDGSSTPKDFAGNTLTGRGGNDVYVAKLNSSGVQQYFALAGSTSNDSVTALMVDGSGNVYLTGAISGDAANTPKDFAGNTLTGFGSNDVYVAKLNSSGIQQFFSLAGSTNGDSVTALTVDGSGNVYLTGAIFGTAANTPKDFAGNTLTGFGSTDVYVAKLNSSGVQQFFSLAGSTTTDSVTALMVDGSGNVYVTGRIDGDAADTPKDFAGNTLTGIGGSDVYVAKLSGASASTGFTLTDAELDLVTTTDNLNIGNAISGAITFNESITRAADTNVNLTAGSNNDIAFGTFSLNAGSRGDVSLTTSGSGAITTGDNTGTDITGDDVTLIAGSDGIGSTTNFLRLAATTVTATTTGNGNINLVEADSVNIGANDLDAGSGTITLGSGTFLATATGSILSPVTVASGATLGGTGTTAAVTPQSGGTIAPGTSPGTLNTGNVTLVSGSNFNVEIDGTTVGTQYDQLNVTGTVELGGANLVVTLSYTPANGDSFVIINNDATDAVTGMFMVDGNLIADGGSFTVGSDIFVIDYSSGSDSNDVTITVQSNTPPVVDLDGAGGTNHFTAAFVEDAGAVSITDSDSTIADAEDAELVSLTLVVNANPDGADEVVTVAGIAFPLNANNTDIGIVGSTTFQVAYVASTRTFTVGNSGGGTSPIADIQSLLRGVTYKNADNTPTTTPRTIAITANDGLADSTVATSTINITDTPEAVRMTVSANAGTETAGTVITVTAIASGEVTGTQTLNVSVVGYSITAGDYLLSNTTITILIGQTSGSVTFTIQDDNLDEFVETATLEFSNPSGGIVLGPDTYQDVSITDNDSWRYDFVKTEAATAAGFNTVLGSNTYSAAAGFGWLTSTVTESYDTGVNNPDQLLRDYHFIRTGSRTFQVDLPDGNYDLSIHIGSTLHTFTNEAVYVDGVLVQTVSTPAGTFVVVPRNVTTTGGKLEVKIERKGGTIVGINGLTILKSNGIPVITTTPTILSYATGDSATPVDPGLTVSDSDSTDLVGASVSITGGFVFPQDVLQFTDQNGITGNYVAATGVLTLTGASSVANYQLALRSVRYLNTSGSPVLQVRTLAFIVDDDTSTSSATRNIQVSDPAFQVSAKFDFNKLAGGNAAGFTSVLGNTAYNSAVGYGWTGSGALETYDTGSGTSTDVQRDYHFIRTGSRTFRTDVTNGLYDVTYTTGSLIHAFTKVDVIINGIQVDTVTTLAGQFYTKTYTVSVTNGRIEFAIAKKGGTIVAISGLEIVPAVNPLLAAPGFERPAGPVHFLTQAELESSVEQAVGIWTTSGLSSADAAKLRSVNFQIASLSGNRLGDASRSLFRIDDDASGYGWSLPGRNLPGSMDLLTVVLHELGHVLGHADHYDPDHSGQIMSGTLAPSQSRTLQPVATTLLSSLDSLFSTPDRRNGLSLLGSL